MTRFVPMTVLLAVLAASRIASAQSTGDTGTGSLPNGATIEFQHLKVYDPGDKKFIETEATSDNRLRAFNRAQCNCARAHRHATTPIDPKDPMAVGWFQYLVIESAISGVRKPVDFWVGASCETDMTRNDGKNCKKLDYLGILDLDGSLYPSGISESFNLYDVVNGHLHDEETAAANPSPDPTSMFDPAACQPIEGNSPIYAFVSTTGATDTYDYETTQNAGALSTDPTTVSTGIDTRPPAQPTGIRIAASDESIKISWDATTAGNADVAYYQALCADIDGSVVRHRAAARKYVTTRSLCDDAAQSDYDLEKLETSTIATPGEADVALDYPVGAFGDLDEAYICGQAGSATATSLQISGLTNGHQYQVIFLTVDLHGNYVGTYFDHTITPVPVTDFWEDLHDRGSKTEGGLCLLAETYGDDSALTGALRAFRDDTLGGSAAGRWLGGAYYATLGKLGALVHGSLALRIAAGVVLAPVVALALAWHWLTLPGLVALIALVALRRRLRQAWHWRRLAPRRGVLIAGAGLALLAALPGRAYAGKYEPYWENDPLDKSADQNGAPSGDPNYDPSFDPALDAKRRHSQEDPVDSGPGDVHWHVGIRMGPYTPDIDKQLGGTSPGPYKQMFGGYSLLPMIDVDRVLWSGFGQVAVGGTIGYLQKSASAFVDGSLPSDPVRMRVPGAENKFRLIPFALTATYRFTYLDDDYGIPVVPYVRGGLAYYVWSVNAPTGGFAEVCKGSGTEPMCDQNKALGASLGVQGSIGLSFRAERIESSAATSLRQSGLQHAGVFGELSIAKVDGFGSDTKLSVGDRTWFAGVDFEF